MGYDGLDLSPGVEPLCGYDWIRQHQHDLADWHPTIEIIRPDSKQTITIKSREAEEAVIKTLRDKKK